ncbi:Uncharacterised protein [Klebsiella oxytoca]|nr:Uncharacterised protein [Klebsiella oxytoca]
MLRNLILYWLTHGYAIICSIAIAAGDYFMLAALVEKSRLGGGRIRLGRDLTDRALGLTLGGKRYSSQSSNTTPHRLIAQAIVVGTDHTIICWRTSLMPIMRLTTQNMLSLK